MGPAGQGGFTNETVGAEGCDSLRLPDRNCLSHSVTGTMPT